MLRYLMGLLVVSSCFGQWASVRFERPENAIGYEVHGGIPHFSATGYSYLEPYGNQSRAILWNSPTEYVNLHPLGNTQRSIALCGDGISQGGVVSVNGQDHASIWHGTSESWVDLHASHNFGSNVTSSIFGVSQDQQVGYSYSYLTERYKAILWHGLSNWIDLTPTGSNIFDVLDAKAYGTDGDYQVGAVDVRPAGSPPGTPYFSHASLWAGSSISWIDLHPPVSNINRSMAYSVADGQQVGDIQLWDAEANRYRAHAALWFGTPNSFIDLNPINSIQSAARNVHSGIQVGDVSFYAGETRAALWHGTSESWVDLHAFLEPHLYSRSAAFTVWTDGITIYVAGMAVQQGESVGILWIGAHCFGDISHDNRIDLTDLSILLSNFGTQGNYFDGELTSDGYIGLDDLALSLTLFGTTCP